MNYQKWDLHLWPKKGCEDFTRFVLYYNWSWIGNKHTLYLAVLTNHASSLEYSLMGSGTLVIQLHCDDKHSKLPSLTIMPFFLPFFGDQRRKITSQPSMLTLKYFRARTLDCTKDHKWPAGTNSGRLEWGQSGTFIEIATWPLPFHSLVKSIHLFCKQDHKFSSI